MAAKSLKSIAEPCGTFAEPHTTLKGGAAARAARGPVRVKGGEKHRLDCYQIDDLDEISGETQIARVWCRTHRKFEWHSIPLDMVQDGGAIVTTRKPLFTA